MLGTGARREYGVGEGEKSFMTGLTCRAMAFPLPCSMTLSSTQDRLVLAFFSRCAGSVGTLFSAWLSVRLILQQLYIYIFN